MENTFASYALFPRKLDTIATFPLSCDVTSNSPSLPLNRQQLYVQIQLLNNTKHMATVG